MSSLFEYAFNINPRAMDVRNRDPMQSRFAKKNRLSRAKTRLILVYPFFNEKKKINKNKIDLSIVDSCQRH